jgi:hypothetical protein
VYFLWRFPWGFPRWTLSSTLLYGVRTFLEIALYAQPRGYPGCVRSIALLDRVAVDQLFGQRGVFRDREGLRKVASRLMILRYRP